MLSRFKLFAPSLLALSLIACSSVPHQSLTPELKNDIVQGSTSVEWPSPEWWLGYQRSELNELISLALSHSPTLIEAQLRIDQALAISAQARAATLPQVSANTQYTRQRFSENDMAPPPWAGSWTDSASLRLNANYNLDFWGKNKSILDARVAEIKQKMLQEQHIRTQLATQIAHTYFEWQGIQQQLTIVSNAVAQRDQVYRLTQERYDEGIDTQAEVFQAKAELESTEVEAYHLQEQLTLTSNKLALLAGVEPSQLPPLSAQALPDLQMTFPPDVPLHLILYRADIQAARELVNAEQSRVSAAEAAFYPDVSINLFTGFSVTGSSDLLQSSNRIMGVQPIIYLPIFSAGELQSQLDQQQAQANLAINAYNQTVLNAVNQVSNTLASWNLLAPSMTKRQAARASIEQAYRVAKERYEAGLGNYLTVLTAQQAVLAQQRQEADLYTRARLLEVELVQALGGGYSPAVSNSVNQ